MFELDTPRHPWHPDEDLYPQELIRQARRVRLTGYLALTLAILMFCVLLPTNPGLAGLLNPLSVVALIPLLSMVLMMAWGRRQLMRRVRADDQRCLSCSHPLSGMSPPGTCPHCGRQETPARIQWAWRRAAGDAVPADPPPAPDDAPAVLINSKELIRSHPCRFGITRSFLPRACLRRVYPWAFSLLGAALILDLVALMADLGLDLDQLIDRRWQLLEVGVYLLLYLAFFIIVARLNWSLKRHARGHGGRLCLECGQDLDPDLPRGQCPECGGPYDRDANISIWNAFDRTTHPLYAGRKAPPTPDPPGGDIPSDAPPE